MTFMPSPVAMNAFIAGQMFQAMMGYPMTIQAQPSLPTSLPLISYVSPPLSPLSALSPIGRGYAVPETYQSSSHQSSEAICEGKGKKTVVEDPVDDKPHLSSEMEHEGDNDDENDKATASEEQLIAELRRMAMDLKKILLRRFKRDRKANKPGRRPLKGDNECTFKGCNFRAFKYSVLQRHIGTHYPDVYFCPACHSSFTLMEHFDRHFQQQTTSKQKGRDEPCIESEEAMRYEVARDKERFNIYYLGVMEDYPMSSEHFEALAGRRRGGGEE